MCCKLLAYKRRQIKAIGTSACWLALHVWKFRLNFNANASWIEFKIKTSFQSWKCIDKSWQKYRGCVEASLNKCLVCISGNRAKTTNTALSISKSRSFMCVSRNNYWHIFYRYGWPVPPGTVLRKSCVSKLFNSDYGKQWSKLFKKVPVLSELIPGHAWFGVSSGRADQL